MHTITINVNERLALEFRKKAEEEFGRKKGYLAKAVSQAFSEWLHKRDDSIEQALKILEKGTYAPQLKYSHRGELHERPY